MMGLFCTFKVLNVRAQSFGYKGLTPLHSFHSAVSGVSTSASLEWECEDSHVPRPCPPTLRGHTLAFPHSHPLIPAKELLVMVREFENFDF